MLFGNITKDILLFNLLFVFKGLLQKNLPIETFERDLKVARIWVRKIIWNIAKEIVK